MPEGQLHRPMFADGQSQVAQDIAVQRMEDVVVLESEKIRLLPQSVQQKGANHPQRIFLGKEGQGLGPGGKVRGRGIAAEKEGGAPLLFLAQQAQGSVFLQLLAHGRFIQRKRAVKAGKVIPVNSVGDLASRESLPVG